MYRLNDMGVAVQEELDVKLNCAVTNIDRSGATPIVTYKDSATNKEASITAEEYVVVHNPSPCHLLPALIDACCWIRLCVVTTEESLNHQVHGLFLSYIKIFHALSCSFFVCCFTSWYMLF